MRSNARDDQLAGLFAAPTFGEAHDGEEELPFEFEATRKTDHSAAFELPEVRNNRKCPVNTSLCTVSWIVK